MSTILTTSRHCFDSYLGQRGFRSEYPRIRWHEGHALPSDANEAAILYLLAFHSELIALSFRAYGPLIQPAWGNTKFPPLPSALNGET